MEIKREYHIEEAAEDKRDGLARPTLQHVYIDQNGQGPIAVACNGSILACVPVVQADATEVGLYQASIFKAARKAKASLPVVVVAGDNETVTLPLAGGVTMPRCDDLTHANHGYLRYEELTPTRQPNAAVVGLNVRYLVRLAQALGTDEVALVIDPSILLHGLGKPIIVLPRGEPVVQQGEKPVPPFGLLMPMITRERKEE